MKTLMTLMAALMLSIPAYGLAAQGNSSLGTLAGDDHGCKSENCDCNKCKCDKEDCKDCENCEGCEGCD